MGIGPLLLRAIWSFRVWVLLVFKKAGGGGKV